MSWEVHSLIHLLCVNLYIYELIICHISILYYTSEIFLIFVFMELFPLRITEIAILISRFLFLVTTLCLQRMASSLVIFVSSRKAPDREWVLTHYMWFKGKDEY